MCFSPTECQRECMEQCADAVDTRKDRYDLERPDLIHPFTD